MIRGHASQPRPPTGAATTLQPRMRSKPLRDPSLDSAVILARWLQFGSHVILLKDRIRQVQRRVILLRLRREALGGTLARIVQAFDWCAENEHPSLLSSIF